MGPGLSYAGASHRPGPVTGHITWQDGAGRTHRPDHRAPLCLSSLLLPPASPNRFFWVDVGGWLDNAVRANSRARPGGKGPAVQAYVGSGSGGRNPPAMLRKGDGWPKNEFWQKIIAIYVASPASPLCPTCRLLPMEVRVPFRPTSCRAGLAVPSRPAATPEAVPANHRLVITTFGTFDSRGGLALPSMAGHGSGETAQGALQTALRRE